MKTENVHCPTKPEELRYNLLNCSLAEVWLRKNIVQQTVLPFEPESEEETLEYVYDEVFFQTTASREEIEADIEGFWQIGASWKPEVPESKEQKIVRLEKELATQKQVVEQNRSNSDMAIAELTMIMAAMMGGGV